jgi:hypothetical protein
VRKAALFFDRAAELVRRLGDFRLLSGTRASSTGARKSAAHGKLVGISIGIASASASGSASASARSIDRTTE